MQHAKLESATLSAVTIRQDTDDGGKIIALDVTVSIAEPDDETIAAIFALVRQPVTVRVSAAGNGNG